MRKRTYIIGSIAIIIFATGAIFKYMHLPGASISIGVGLTLFALGFCPSFVFDKWSIEPTKAARRSYLILLLTIELIVLSSLAQILHIQEGSSLLAYLAILTFTIYIVFFTRHTEGRQFKLARSRQLACILFTDIVGFTALMGENEEIALDVLEKNRHIQKASLRKYRGRLIKEIGDGTLIVFYTAFEAMQFAIEVQQKTKRENYATRIGLHISEILFTDEDIFGDGVNVASRIAGMTKSNEICFSQSVFQNIKNRDDIEIKLLGPTALKGVDYSLELYSIQV